MIVEQVRRAVAADLDGHLDLLETLVEVDSGADRPDGVERVLHLCADRLAPLGAELSWASDGGVAHLHARLPGGSRTAVLLGHADTVFPAGSAPPYRCAGGMAYGPGVADMKGGLVVALAATEQLVAQDLPRPTLDLVVVGDEETRTTPPPFLDAIRAADACLVLECGRPGGGFVTGRKTGLWAHLTAEGRAAHSGTEPERGSNALLALCREVVRVAALDGARPGLSVSLGTLSGGTAVNAVPERAVATFDIRSPEPADLEWAVREIRSFADHPGIRLGVTADQAWPAMRATPASEALARTYRELASAAGIPAYPLSTGGMSDGCWASAAGVPTLDGLGPVGGADHGPDEYLETTSIPERAALLAGVLAVLEGGGG